MYSIEYMNKNKRIFRSIICNFKIIKKIFLFDLNCINSSTYQKVKPYNINGSLGINYTLLMKIIIYRYIKNFNVL